MADPAGRSRAWGVLAVSLALMALVTALSSATGRGEAGSANAFERPTSGHHSTARAARTAHTARTEEHRSTVNPETHAPDRALSFGARAGSLGKRALLQARKDTVRGTGSTDLGQEHAPDTGVAADVPSPVFTTTGPRPSTAHTAGGATTGARTSHPATRPSTSHTRNDSRTSPKTTTTTTDPTTTTTTLVTFPKTTATKTAPTTSTTTGPTTTTTGPTTTTTTTTTPAPGANRSGGVAAAGTGMYPGHGSIDAPATAASFAAAGGGTVSAQAAWTGAATLELEIACPGGVSVARAGLSGLSLEIDDSHGSGGTCTVTLSLLPGAHADVSFTLVVEPAA